MYHYGTIFERQFVTQRSLDQGIVGAAALLTQRADFDSPP